MAFKRSTVRSRPSPPRQRSDFRFSVFYFVPFFQKGSNRQSISRGSPRRSARDIQSGICEANARGLPLDPVRLHQDREAIFVSLFFILRFFFKRDRTDSPSRAVRFGGARGTYNRGFAKQIRGACPPRSSQYLSNPQAAVNKGLRSFLYPKSVFL